MKQFDSIVPWSLSSSMWWKWQLYSIRVLEVLHPIICNVTITIIMVLFLCLTWRWYMDTGSIVRLSIITFLWWGEGGGVMFWNLPLTACHLTGCGKIIKIDDKALLMYCTTVKQQALHSQIYPQSKTYHTSCLPTLTYVWSVSSTCCKVFLHLTQVFCKILHEEFIATFFEHALLRNQAFTITVKN